MKALVIDDEQKARRLLKSLIEDNCPQIKNIELAENLMDGIEAIRKHQPELVFLDIEMPGHSGLQILDFFETDKIDFEIIFTTAYSEHAIKAFEINAIDYLLKPLRDEQVEAAVIKAIENRSKTKLGERLEELKNTLKASSIRKIGLPVSDGVLFVKFDDLILLKADRMYTKVYTLNDGEVLVSKPMKFFESILEELSEFYRPHRSFLINLKHIKQYVNKDGGYIIMDNNETVSISRDKKDEFFTVMQNV